MKSMKECRWLHVFIIAQVLCMGCSKTKNQKVNAKEMINWFQNSKNGYLKEVKSGDFSFTLQYKPLVYDRALQELQGDNIVSNNVDDDAYFFTLKVKNNTRQDITRYNTSDFNQIQKNIYYLSYMMQKEVFLIDGNDTLNCDYYVFERSFNLADHQVFNLGFFPEKINQEDKTLILKSDYFNTIPIKFKFKQSALKQTPKLK